MPSVRLKAAALIIAIIIIGGFALSVPRAREVPAPLATNEPSASVAPVVTIHDAYSAKKGVHTITGAVMAPDACTTVSADALVSGVSTTTSAASTSPATGEASPAIELSLSMPLDTGVCLQVPTKVTFSATAEAPAGVPILVSVNGATASTTRAAKAVTANS